ncbi:MAG: copper homeostasis protein CutC [Lewinellaceae bacterium]|nr:copper homeostasis protein CutC [Saprospiraceae bacterium]MCB9330258.1 copper homeostasis protein CutC [Lewinellaceae bacterium]
MLEICAANLQSALAAQRAGAQRIELCSALDAGGLTPSAGLIRAVCRQLTIPVNVLIRPREGHFCYTDAELAIMLDDIRFCREAGANGVVIGALTMHSELNLEQMAALVEAAEGLDITCHRAFDFTPDPLAALDTLVALGIPRVLSSGQAASAFEGRFLLKKLVQHAAGRISIMPGAGINAANIAELAKTTGSREFHLSGRKKVEQVFPDKKIPGLELEYWESAENAIREVLEVLRP